MIGVLQFKILLYVVGIRGGRTSGDGKWQTQEL